MADAAPRAEGGIRLGQPSGRWILLAAVLGSSMAFLDSTVVNVALPTIGRSLHTSLGGLQWTVTAYTLTLAGLILLGGSLGDRMGRRRIFVTGVIWFAVASALCGLSPDIGVLIGARALQGIGGALLTPGSARGPAWAAWPGRRARCSAAGWSERPAGAGSSSSTCRSPRWSSWCRSGMSPRPGTLRHTAGST
jgi:MFS family permease